MNNATQPVKLKQKKEMERKECCCCAELYFLYKVYIN